MGNESFRLIPPVNVIADRLAAQLGADLADMYCLSQARVIQQSIRSGLKLHGDHDPEVLLDAEISNLVSLLSSSKYTAVINATGIVVHTNLGRAAVSDRTAEAMRQAASSAVALEIDPSSGQRGGRMNEIASLLRLLAGAEDSLVVNNNAAAVLLVLSVLASGKQVAVSRAEAVEIGGGFRIPDVLAQSGASLVEVGTTNRTYAADFAEAAAQGVEVFLRIHPSNFSISGFVAAPSNAELRDTADKTLALVLEDLGSGTLVPTETYGINHEPTVQESLRAGMDVVMFSGDKLLGGPQAGVICGRKDLIRRIATHPLARAVRADKTALAGIAETLRHYARGDFARQIPVWRAISISPAILEDRAHHILTSLAASAPSASTVSTVNYVGGGSLPDQALPGIAIRLSAASSGAASALAKALRLATPAPVFARIEDDAVFIELRTVMSEDDQQLLAVIANVLAMQEG